jgi:hypothetical protein
VDSGPCDGESGCWAWWLSEVSTRKVLSQPNLPITGISADLVGRDTAI